MLRKNRKPSLTAVSVMASAAMLMSQALFFPQISADAAGTDLYVGYTGRNGSFSTVQAAVDKAASLSPSSESDRVTIHIAPGTYREQVVVQTPYVSFVNDSPNEKVTLTWYYGIGYKYYSANAKGYYDKNAAASKSAKNIANYRWGATVQLWPKATNFKAENITFENSFNRYITQEELADGVEATGETLRVARNTGADVQSKAYTERAAAFSADAAYCEFLNCSFLSSQDTLYTGGSPEYYKNCQIEGQTDYIFGDGSVVFDSCELRWKGYSSGTTGGYITAARDDNNDDTGYLFYNCNVTANPQLKVSTGYFGRPWRDTAKVMFVNTTLDSANLINEAGWTSMSGVQPENVSGFKESGTKTKDGKAVDTSKRKGHIISESDAAGIKLVNYMKNWTPSYLNASAQSQQSQQGQQEPQNVPVADGAITYCSGWFESAAAEWDSSAIGDNVKVSYSVKGKNQFTQVDSQLIRGNRVDIVGLNNSETYTLLIEGSKGRAMADVQPMTFDRSGYAHGNNDRSVGAYNNDGTLKQGVEVIYVTDSNKDSISYGGKTGLYNIFYSAKPKNVVFRFIGKVGVPSGAKANDGKQNDGSSMLYLQNAENVTIEGIGADAALDKWGFEMKRSTGCEVRNLRLEQYPDDGISMTGSSDSKSSYMWVHNNTIDKGYNQFAGNGTVDADKADGDGSVDIKWSENITVSYNVFNNCHKTSLVGGGPSQFQDWITYHHNWFKSTESRNPRARNAHIHCYNNYFSDNKQYGIGASYNSKIFSEANYFENTYLPLDAVNMGSDAYSGTIKSYNDKFEGCNMGSGLAYSIVNSRNAAASIANLKSGGDAYDNFDLNMYSYTAQTPDSAKSEVMNFAGAMQTKVYNKGTASQQPEQPSNPTPTEPQGPVTVYGSDTIASVAVENVLSSNGISWSVENDTKVGSKAFTDRDFLITALPSSLEGSERVLTACDSKNYDADLASLEAKKDSTVYIAMDSRVASVPSWMSGYTKTGETVGITDATDQKQFDLYSKNVSAGEKIKLGTNGQSSGVMQYVVFASALPEPTESPTEQPTEAPTDAPEKVVYGDANCDGNVNLSDALLILQYIANSKKFPIDTQGLINADVYNRGDGVTPLDSLTLQKVDAGVYTLEDLPVTAE
ncbi:pectinesterase family protein [Ruminococcus sp. XPD3002]|uniref:pectinesterase family protein n=1 Tax=Ruminococcus sp. XPD3002 TaxID=1452269 RepID=UPI00091E6C85|nr:Pectate lyase [Ruminococcus flavefaciens]